MTRHLRKASNKKKDRLKQTPRKKETPKRQKQYRKQRKWPERQKKTKIYKISIRRRGKSTQKLKMIQIKYVLE